MTYDSAQVLNERYGPNYKWFVTVTGMIGVVSMVLAMTTVNVAVPDVMGAFGIGQDKAQWMSSAYTATMTAGMLMNAWITGVLGERRTFVGALFFFSVGALMGGAAPTEDVLIIFRTVQGFSAGVAQPLVMATIFTVFPPERRGSAMGVFGLGVVFAPAIGPTLGGLMIEYFSWRYVFAFEVVVCILVIAVSRRIAAGPSTSVEGRFDLGGVYDDIASELRDVVQQERNELQRQLDAPLGDAALALEQRRLADRVVGEPGPHAPAQRRPRLIADAPQEAERHPDVGLVGRGRRVERLAGHRVRTPAGQQLRRNVGSPVADGQERHAIERRQHADAGLAGHVARLRRTRQREAGKHEDKGGVGRPARYHAAPMLDALTSFVKSSGRGLAAFRRLWPNVAWGLGLWLAVVVLPIGLVGTDLSCAPAVAWSLAALCPLSLVMAGLSGQPLAVMGFALAGQLPALVACPVLLGTQATGPLHALLVAVLILGLLAQTWQSSRPVGSTHSLRAAACRACLCSWRASAWVMA